MANDTKSNLVGKNHDTVVGFATESATNTLGRVAHCIERQEVTLSNMKLISKILQSCLWSH